ncbi:SIS domain-containing protein [uncultured Bacteroides sp.]|uniref:SIS domain-containing protein n=1 Tax=uncultured Bacteroides sp. TaxID=162156 RepID=UPI002AAB43FF|nr:SIS domain-containing protein [uncultured Bacteroides sp.]
MDIEFMSEFLKEIREQPTALRDTLLYYLQGDGAEKLKSVVDIWNTGKYDKIIFTGMGSSFFISYAATCLLNKHSITSFAINAGELLHYQLSLLNSKSLLVCISQSGESFEIVNLIQKLPKDITIISVCNEEKSFLAEHTEISLLSKAGKEDMTSTKTFVSSYLVIYILSLALVREFDDKIVSKIEKMISVVDFLINHSCQWLSDSMTLLAHTPFIQLIGRGPIYATVKQSALMFMEATGTPSSGTLGGEFRHGPMEMVKDGFKAIVFAPSGETYDQSVSMAKDISKYGGKVIFITNISSMFDDKNIFNITIPFLDSDLFAIPAVIPLQLIVNQWALENNIIPGAFTRGAKVTAIE